MVEQTPKITQTTQIKSTLLVERRFIQSQLTIGQTSRLQYSGIDLYNARNKTGGNLQLTLQILMFLIVEFDFF